MTKFTLPYHIVNAINALEDADCGAAYKAINAYIQSEGKLDLSTLPPTARCIILLAKKDLDKIVKRKQRAEQRKASQKSPKTSKTPTTSKTSKTPTTSKTTKTPTTSTTSTTPTVCS